MTLVHALDRKNKIYTLKDIIKDIAEIAKGIVTSEMLRTIYLFIFCSFVRLLTLDRCIYYYIYYFMLS